MMRLPSNNAKDEKAHLAAWPSVHSRKGMRRGLLYSAPAAQQAVGQEQRQTRRRAEHQRQRDEQPHLLRQARRHVCVHV